MFSILTQFYIQNVHMSSHMSPPSSFSLLLFYWRDIWRIDDNRVEGSVRVTHSLAEPERSRNENLCLSSDSCTSSLAPPFHTFTCILSWIPSPSHSLLVYYWFSPWHVIITTSTFISLTFKKIGAHFCLRHMFIILKINWNQRNSFSVFLLLHLPTQGSHFIGTWCYLPVFILLAILA